MENEVTEIELHIASVQHYMLTVDNTAASLKKILVKTFVCR